MVFSRSWNSFSLVCKFVEFMGRVFQLQQDGAMETYNFHGCSIGVGEANQRVHACRRTVHFDEEIGLQEVLFGGNAEVMIKTRPVLLIMVM